MSKVNGKVSETLAYLTSTHPSGHFPWRGKQPYNQ